MAFSPTLGRWTQMDPSGYTDGLNLYEGLADNPVANLDPSGLAIEVIYDPSEPIPVQGIETFLSNYRKQTRSRSRPGGKDFINDHQWGGTGGMLPGGIEWKLVDRTTSGDKGCVACALTYEAQGKLKVRTYQLELPNNPKIPEGIVRIANEFNRMVIAHEQKHVDNTRKHFSDAIVGSGSGATEQEACRKALAQALVEMGRRAVNFFVGKDKIDNDGDRKRGMDALNAMRDFARSHQF